MSDLRSRPLRHALKQAAVTGTAGSFLLGAAVVGLAVPGAGAATAAPAAATASSAAGGTTAQSGGVTIHTEQVASRKKRKLSVGKMITTAASLKGRPYRYGAAGPKAFDCSGYTLYVVKKQGIKLPRTAAQQYARTLHVSKKRVRTGDLIFYYNRGGIYHVGIYAGKGKMWAAPHSGAVVRLQKVYGSNWKVGKIR